MVVKLFSFLFFLFSFSPSCFCIYDFYSVEKYEYMSFLWSPINENARTIFMRTASYQSKYTIDEYLNCYNALATKKGMENLIFEKKLMTVNNYLENLDNEYNIKK